jgi:hypothetical protein
MCIVPIARIGSKAVVLWVRQCVVLGCNGTSVVCETAVEVGLSVGGRDDEFVGAGGGGDCWWGAV